MVTTGGMIIGQGEPLGVFGIDPVLDPQVRTYVFAEGAFPRQSGEIMFTERYATEKGYTVGQNVSLLTPGGLRVLKISGTLAAEGVALLNGGDIALIGLEEALSLRDGRLDTLSLMLQPGVEPETMIATVQPLLPEGVTINLPEARSGQMTPITNFITAIMYMIAGLILLLSSTLIYNTMAVAVAQRRAEIGLLRALGVTRSGVRLMFILEAGVLGFIGSGVGVVVGYLLVGFASNLPVIPAYGGDLYMSTPDVSVPPLVPVVALLLGTAVSMLAGYLPSRSASQVDPVEALTPQKAESGYMRINRRRTFLAFALLTLGFIGIFVVDLTKLSPLPVLLVYVMMGAAILFLPTLFWMLGHFLPALMQRLAGMAGYLAAENVTKKPGRMTATATVLLVGIWAGVVASGSNFGYSGFTDEWNTGENSWALTLVGPGASPMKPQISLPEGIETEIAARPEVDAMVAERIGKTALNGSEVSIRALEVATFRAEGGRLLWKNGDEAAAYDRLIQTESPAVLVSAFLSTYNNLSIGDTITFETPTGAVDFEIVGTLLSVIEIGSPAESAVVMDRDLYSRLWGDTRIDRLMLKLQPDADLQAVRRDLLSTYALKGVMVMGTAEMSQAFAQRMQSIGIVSKMLSLMFLGTLLLGIANTLFIVILDRRREIGMLRALGLQRRQMTLSVVLEAAILVLMTALLSVPLGVFNNWINTYAMENFIGVRFGLAVSDLVLTVAIVLMAAAGAAFLPARYAGQSDVLEALRYE
jgi:putative ABC transport system permease protein